VGTHAKVTVEVLFKQLHGWLEFIPIDIVLEAEVRQELVDAMQESDCDLIILVVELEIEVEHGNQGFVEFEVLHHFLEFRSNGLVEYFM
jgi:hypothetical protein